MSGMRGCMPSPYTAGLTPWTLLHNTARWPPSTVKTELYPTYPTALTPATAPINPDGGPPCGNPPGNWLPKSFKRSRIVASERRLARRALRAIEVAARMAFYAASSLVAGYDLCDMTRRWRIV
mmetsp:Transcript_5765/g.16169  ORF Transcript_5765/g.16169 Transcript_5765/m.16169 type:complete len:123 (+) Transcript_5765:712-1080(+)